MFVREAINAINLALAISSAVASFMPKIFCWFGQIRTQTLNNMIVPNHAPRPITSIPAEKVNAPIAPPKPSNAPTPVNQVTAADIRNQSNALGAIYLLIAAGPGPPLSFSAKAAPTPGTCTKLK